MPPSSFGGWFAPTAPSGRLSSRAITEADLARRAHGRGIFHFVKNGVVSSFATSLIILNGLNVLNIPI